jgi:hypothetical protein
MQPNIKNLLRGEVAEAWMGANQSALFQYMPKELGVVMQDGGIPVTGIARALSEDEWEGIAKEFLLTAER